MKRFFAFALILTFFALPVHAEGADIRANLPEDIRVFFSRAQYNGCVLGPDAYVEITGTEAGDFAFAALTEGSSQTLYGFTRRDGGGWTYWLKTASALPQRAGEMHLNSAYGTLYGTLYCDHPSLEISFQSEEIEEYWDWTAVYELSGSGGQWMLVYLKNQLNAYCFARVYADRIVYQNDNGDALSTVYGTVQRNLRYHSFSSFPLTPAAAREKLTQAPVLPQNSELTAQNIRFTGGQTFPVYSGPGEYYLRAADGAAKVSTNDWIQVFGTENGYALIQYAISAGHMRFGYIDQSSLPADARVPALGFAASAAFLETDATLTDDPLGSGAPLRALPAGSTVTHLAVMGDWAYVEVDGDAPVRGFVPKSALAKIVTGSFQNGEYSAFASAQIGAACTVTVAVSAPDAWQNAVTGYTLYVNNTPFATASGPYAEGYQFTVTLPEGVSVLGLCPLRNGLPAAQETIILPIF